MSISPRIPEIPTFGLSPTGAAFLRDMLQLADARFEKLIDELSARIHDYADPPRGVSIITLDMVLNILDTSIQAKLSQLQAKVRFRKSFLECTREEKKEINDYYLDLKRSNCEGSLDMEPNR